MPDICTRPGTCIGNSQGLLAPPPSHIQPADQGPGSLHHAACRSGASGAAGAELLLQDLVEPADSKAKPRRVGPTLSKRLHLMLTCEDPDAVVEGDPDEAE
jgi:hypothetical protein